MRAASVVVLALGMLASDAAADGFAWTAPASCPTTSDMLARIERRLDRETEIHDIEVAVVKARAGFTATINNGRTLNAASCSDLADAVAVIVARLATEAAAREVVTPAPPAPTDIGFIAPPPAPHRERLDRVVEPVAGTAPRWTGGMRLLALSGIGMTPKVGYGGELAGYIQHGSTFAELGHARWAKRESSDAQSYLDIGVSLLAVRGGWSSPKMPLRAWVGAEIGAMNGVAHGIQVMTTDAVAATDSASGRWIAATSGFGVNWPMTRYLRVTGTFELAVPLATTDFRFPDNQRIYQPDPISARCALGLEVSWR